MKEIFIKRVQRLMKLLRTTELGSVENWELKTPHNLFETVDLYHLDDCPYDYFVMVTSSEVILIPKTVPCLGCSIISMHGNPRYSKMTRVNPESIDWFESEPILESVDFIDAVKWLVQWDEQGRKNCPIDLW